MTRPFSLGARLRALRERCGMSQIDLARVLDVPVDSVQNWEQDRTEPRGLARNALVRFIAHMEAGFYEQAARHE